MYKITMPVVFKIWVKKPKNISISLNRYRNAHHFTSNNIKKRYKDLVKTKLAPYWKIKLVLPISLVFKYYNGTHRRSDLEWFCAIQNKFFQDALVELGYIEDDNYDFITDIRYIYWWYDKWKAKVEIEIKES